MPEPPAAADALELARAALTRVFKLREFRGGQEAVILVALAGRDVLAVMPTGAGKSLTYQLPAVIESGLTVVVSPLIALMKDQTESLARRGVAAMMLNSSQTPAQQAAVLASLPHLKLLYLAPERLHSTATLEALRAVQVSRLVIDEAHCVSQWGHDFRPDYLRLGEARLSLGSPPVSALTATATLPVQEDILATLGMEGADRVVTGFERPNLSYRVVPVPGEAAKREALRVLLERLPGPGLVYVGTRREAEDLAGLLTGWGLRASYYHGARPQAERSAVQDAFQSGKLEVIVATNAFGMGVDKQNVRFVIHYRLPGTLEAYYQEAGRAGRDGKAARCILLFDEADRQLQQHFTNSSIPSEFELKRVWAYLHAARDDQDVVNLRLSNLEKNLDMPGGKLRVVLSQLVRLGGLEVDENANGLYRARVSITVPEFDMAALERLRQNRLRLLEEMLHFASEPACRRDLILRYFGEGAGARPCGTCDHCAPPREALPPWSRRLLESIAAYPGEPRATALKRLGIEFADWTPPELERLCDSLGEAGWLKTTQRAPRPSERALALLAQPESPAAVPRDALEAVLQLYRAQHSVSDIAARLETDPASIEKRLLKLLERGTLGLTELLPADRFETIRRAAEIHGFSPLSALKAAVPEASDFELKAARLVLEAEG